jgi:rRNA maturation RNase YbeY
MSNISFFYEEVDFTLKNKTSITQWIQKVIESESDKAISNINFILCSDPYLNQINIQYLNHNTYTDIITFNNSDDPRFIDSDIYISLDRVSENSKKFGESMDIELCRVMIHGILHLLGYKDKSFNEKELMRKKENECLTLLKN